MLQQIQTSKAGKKKEQNKNAIFLPATQGKTVSPFSKLHDVMAALHFPRGGVAKAKNIYTSRAISHSKMTGSIHLYKGEAQQRSIMWHRQQHKARTMRVAWITIHINMAMVPCFV